MNRMTALSGEAHVEILKHALDGPAVEVRPRGYRQAVLAVSG